MYRYVHVLHHILSQLQLMTLQSQHVMIAGMSSVEYAEEVLLAITAGVYIRISLAAGSCATLGTK